MTQMFHYERRVTRWKEISQGDIPDRRYTGDLDMTPWCPVCPDDAGYKTIKQRIIILSHHLLLEHDLSLLIKPSLNISSVLHPMYSFSSSYFATRKCWCNKFQQSNNGSNILLENLNVIPQLWIVCLETKFLS